MRLMLGIFLMQFSLAGYAGTFHIEYSKSMALALQEGQSAIGWLAQRIDKHGPVLFAGVTKKPQGQRIPLSMPPAEMLRECFVKDRLNDRCDANDELERVPDAGFEARLGFLLQDSPNRNDAVAFAAYEIQTKPLKQLLNKLPVPYVLDYFPVGKSKLGIYVLSFKNATDSRYLVAQTNTSMQDRGCRPKLICNNGRRELALLDQCFKNRLPGHITDTKIKYAVNRRKFVHCQTPPLEGMEDHKNWSRIRLPSDEQYQRRMKGCQSSQERGNAGASQRIRFQVQFEVQRANPDVYQKLPKPMKQLLADLANVPASSYLQSISRKVTVTPKSCS